MDQSPDLIQEIKEAAYLLGKQNFALRTAMSIMSEAFLHDDPIFDVVRLRLELQECRSHIRAIFEEFSLEYPGDDRYLPEIIEKDLFRQLQSLLDDSESDVLQSSLKAILNESEAICTKPLESRLKEIARLTRQQLHRLGIEA